jgi:hypothetical protein
LPAGTLTQFVRTAVKAILELEIEGMLTHCRYLSVAYLLEEEHSPPTAKGVNHLLVEPDPNSSTSILAAYSASKRISLCFN